MFKDPDFPAVPESVGGAEAAKGEVHWIRGYDLVGPSGSLFTEIHPSDCCQGAVEDCWLVAAIASVAEFPGEIEELFVTKDFDRYGRYEIYLHDVCAGSPGVPTHRLIMLSLDFWIPLRAPRARPLF